MLDLDILHTLLKERFACVDIAAAADEVRPFLRDPRELALWARELFIGLIAQVQSAWKVTLHVAIPHVSRRIFEVHSMMVSCYSTPRVWGLVGVRTPVGVDQPHSKQHPAKEPTKPVNIGGKR